jgi:hypothetical protein
VNSKDSDSENSEVKSKEEDLTKSSDTGKSEVNSKGEDWM